MIHRAIRQIGMLRGHGQLHTERIHVNPDVAHALADRLAVTEVAKRPRNPIARGCAPCLLRPTNCRATARTPTLQSGCSRRAGYPTRYTCVVGFALSRNLGNWSGTELLSLDEQQTHLESRFWWQIRGLWGIAGDEAVFINQQLADPYSHFPEFELSSFSYNYTLPHGRRPRLRRLLCGPNSRRRCQSRIRAVIEPCVFEQSWIMRTALWKLSYTMQRAKKLFLPLFRTATSYRCARKANSFS